jgi:hypothetical protein
MSETASMIGTGLFLLVIGLCLVFKPWNGLDLSTKSDESENDSVEVPQLDEILSQPVKKRPARRVKVKEELSASDTTQAVAENPMPKKPRRKKDIINEENQEPK